MLACVAPVTLLTAINKTMENKPLRRQMSIDIDAEREREERLDIAHRLYQALIAQDPNRAITLCDRDGRVLARYYPWPEQRAEDAP
jgi:hypothetical protein